ncbi:MAG: hypothetical protein J6Z36_02005, partial [Clostridia bacterium]|nr:hypothetical protein [Clostridia bacterium]
MERETNNQKKISPKVKKFDGDRESRLMDSARKRLDEGDYITALRLLNRRNENFADDADSCASLADAYELMEAGGQAIKAWYRFLDVCEKEDLSEAYEGLAVNYMNLGRESQAAYYYNQLLRVDPDITEESKMEIMETFSRPKKSLFKVVYPPEKADYTAEMEEGLTFLKEGKYADAREAFSAVPKEANQYFSAQNMVAVSYLLDDKLEDAKTLCENLLAENENDVQVCTTYAAVLGQLKQYDAAKKVAEKLSKAQTEDTDELYKIATVCCENDMHAQALEKFQKLEELIPSDKNILYFKAVAAYTSGDIKQCLDAFDRLLVIYPEAAVARYYYDHLRLYLDNQDKVDMQKPELTYFYTLAQQAR